MIKQDFKIVAIGSSAGGLEPLREIISMLPNPCPSAVILVPHLLKDKESKLSAILARETNINIIKVLEDTSVEPGNIYVLGEGKSMGISNNRLVLYEQSEKINRAIDIFFIALAQDAGSRATGVILSGGGYDGIEGAKAIESKGGIIIVQDPKTAQFPLMPDSLIKNDHPDFVLSPAQIAEKLNKIICV